MKNNYYSVPKNNIDNEHFIFRMGILKKFFQNVLCLDTDTKKAGRFAEHAAFGLAAAASMFFATGIAFITQFHFGNFTTFFFLSLVISYVFKDRINDALKQYLKNILLKKYFDYEMSIFSSPEIKIGSCKEFFSFIRGKDIPKTIKKLRDNFHVNDVEHFYRGETVFTYKKFTNLFSKKFKKIYRSNAIQGINDVLRFNISKFLGKMDDPQKDVFVLNGNSFNSVKSGKTYHLNLIIKYTAQKIPAYRRFRIVLDRTGIKRIERVFTDKANKLNKICVE
ncbi:hypothetical protein HN587_07140 [Candidatus Woesearchaeota archaeon]|jgi:hypothetical protein|nr:hypothetical protein [Candidatus Woesearchaeota archaeon]